MKNYFFLVLLISTLNTQAQQKYWEKNYTIGTITRIAKIQLFEDNKIATIGNYTNSPSYTSNSYFMITDITGNIIDSSTYHFDNGEFLSYDLLKTSTDKFMVGSTLIDSTLYRTISFMEINTEGIYEVLHTIEDVTTPFESNFRAMSQLSDNEFIIVGIKSINITSSLYCIKVNTNGDILWEQTYGSFDNVNQLTDIVSIPDENNFYIYGYVNYLASPAIDSDLYLAKISGATGEIIDEQEFIFDLSEKDGATDLLYDDGYIIMLSGGFSQNSFITKIDTNGAIIWMNDANFTNTGSPSGIVKTSDGNYVVVGNINPVGPEMVNMHLIKLSVETGNIMWQRAYGGAYNDYGYDIALSPDGGFIVAGRQDTLGGASAWVLKLNCMGLLTEPQASFTHTLEGLELYLQNTSQYVYPDSTDGGYFTWNFGDGSTISNQQNPTHTYAQAGSYPVTLTAIVCNDTSTYTQAVAVYPVGVRENGGFMDGGCTLAPMPNNGWLNIACESTANSIEVYTLAGKLIQQFDIQNGGVSTRNLDNGYYIYRLKNTDNTTLQSGKLVIIQ